MNRADLAGMMYRLGHRFGYLIYVLDAFEDRARDARTGDFNPLLVFKGIDARAEIVSAANDVAGDLPPMLAARLRANVEERLGIRPRVLHSGCRKPVRSRWQDALAFARLIREREHAGLFKGAAVLASVAVLAFLFPHQARSTESWHECLGVGMNLMAVGAIFANVETPPVPEGGKKSSGCGGCVPDCDCGDCCCAGCGDCACDC